MTYLSSERRYNRLDVTIVMLLFAGGVLLCLLLLTQTHFDGLYGQDAYAYYDFAGELRAALSEGRAPQPFFWPLGYPALLAATQAVFGTQPENGQAVNVLMGAALAPLVYVLARHIGGERPGALIAGLLMGICGQALQSSLVIMSDIPALFWATVSALALWKYKNDSIGTRHVSSLFWCALTLALAGITRWLYLILVIPWALAAWRGRIRWQETILTVVAASIILVPQMLYSRTHTQPVLNHAWTQGWSPPNALRQVFETVDGHLEYLTVNGLFYARPFYDSYYLAPLFTPFLLFGLLRLLRGQKYAALLLLGGWALLPYLFLAGIPYQNIRFPLIVFPVVAILAGLGVEYAASRIGRIVRQPYPMLAVAVLVIFGAAQTLNAGAHTIGTFIANQQADKAAAAWTGEHVPAGATLYTFGLTLTLQHYTTLNVYEIYYETPATLDQKWTRGQADYLLLNVWNIENQWAGRAPQVDYHWLRDTRGLTIFGKHGNFTLFKIKG